MDDYFNFNTAPFVVVDRLPYEGKRGAKIFFKIQDDDLNFKLARFPLTEQETEDIETELKKCEGKIYVVRKDDIYESYVCSNGKWWQIGMNIY